MSIMQKFTEMVKSLTSNKGNADPPPGVSVPPTDEGAVAMDREPAGNSEPKQDE